MANKGKLTANAIGSAAILEEHFAKLTLIKKRKPAKNSRFWLSPSHAALAERGLFAEPL
jgi:hypothetical protein